MFHFGMPAPADMPGYEVGGGVGMDEGQAVRRVVAIISANAALMARLRSARSLRLAAWCLGGGAIRDVVWAHLSERAVPAPRDLDLAYFDPVDCSPAAEGVLEARLAVIDPGIPWEVRNQARMHLWHHARTGEEVPAVGSLAAGLAVWPEACTAVGAWLDGHDRIQLVAPLGLGDLLGMVVRPNLTRISARDWRLRATAKRWAERWPGVRVVPARTTLPSPQAPDR